MLGNGDEGWLMVGSSVDGTCAVDTGGEAASYGCRKNTVDGGRVETLEELELAERSSL